MDWDRASYGMYVGQRCMASPLNGGLPTVELSSQISCYSQLAYDLANSGKATNIYNIGVELLKIARTANIH